MDIIISNSSKLHVYEQIKDQIKAQIRSGKLAENEALPSLRLLASEIRVAVVTVQKAYTELEQEGYIAGLEKKGFYVAPKNSNLFREELIREAEAHINNAVECARLASMTDGEFMNLVKLLMEVGNDE